MLRCDRCGEDFARMDNLTRHINRRYRCRPEDQEDSGIPANEEKKLKFEANEEKRSRYAVKTPDKGPDDDIPEFDVAEFCGDKPLRRETLYKMMKMLKIPEHRWDHIVSEELEYRQVKDTGIQQ